MVTPPLDPATVASVSALAALPLSPDRRAALAPQLAGLLAAANQLSAVIARDYGHPRPVAPMLRFPGA